MSYARIIFMVAVVITMFFVLQAVIGKSDSSASAQLQNLADKEDIRALINDYGYYLDRRDWDGFSALFAKDGGTWDGGMGVAEGPAAVKEMMVETIGTGANGDDTAQPNLHLFTNERIAVDGDTAEALTKWIFVMQSADDGGPNFVLVGHYADDLVREDGQWKFKYRKVYADMSRPMNLDGLRQDGS